MENYIDGFVFPIASMHLEEYKRIAHKVAEVWKSHGAIAYNEFVGDEMFLEGTRSFIQALNVKDDEKIVFGWVVFPSKEARNLANKNVPLDPRMKALVEPLIQPERLIFDGSRMLYGGFQPLVQSNG